MRRLDRPFHKIATRIVMTASFASALTLAPLQTFADTSTTPVSTTSGASAASTGTLSQDEQRILEIYQYIHQYHVDPIDEDTLTKGAIQGMLDATGDPFSEYFSPQEYQQFVDQLNQTFVGIGIHIQQTDTSVAILDTIQGGPADQAGLKVGDVILTINNQSVQGKSADDVRNLFLGPVNSQVTVQVKRDKQTTPLSFTLTRQQIQLPVVVSKLTPEGLGYIQLVDFSETAADDFTKALQGLRDQGAKGIILDLRGNPGGVLQQAVQIADQFIPSGVIIKTAESDGTSQTYTADGKGIALQTPLVVLVDQNSASAAEALSGSLKLAKRATVVGTKTFGKGTMQVGIPLDSGGVLKLTIGKYYFSDGSNIHHVGIQPDITIQNPDLQYNEAVQLLLPSRHRSLQYSITSSGNLLNGGQASSPPMKVVKGVQYVPLRYTFETFGMPVTWNGSTGDITANNVVFNKNGADYSKGSKPYHLKHPLLMQDGTSYISSDDLSSVLSAQVKVTMDGIQIQDR